MKINRDFKTKQLFFVVCNNYHNKKTLKIQPPKVGVQISLYLKGDSENCFDRIKIFVFTPKYEI